MENTKHIKEGMKGQAQGGGACVTKMKEINMRVCAHPDGFQDW